jgi:hypothetical protein
MRKEGKSQQKFKLENLTRLHDSRLTSSTGTALIKLKMSSRNTIPL